MTALSIFNYADQQVRTVVIDGEPWFILGDLCLVLGLSNPSVVASRLDEAALSQTYISSGGQQRAVTIVNEPGMYEVVIRSDKPQAVAFRRWITSTVLPSIRKTGSYGSQLPSSFAEALELAAVKVREVEALEARAAADAPKVLFADAVATSSSTILVGDLAKILRGNGLAIGANRLFERLREDGFLIRREGSDWNMPTQRAMDLGLFRIKETAITHSEGNVTLSKTPKVTGKGQAYFVNRYAPSRELVAVNS